MLLSGLIERSGIRPAAISGEAEVRSMELDSRRVERGALFVCMPGKHADSHAFIPQAAERGAVAVLAHSPEGFEAARALDLAALWVTREDWRFHEAVAWLARELHGNPTRGMAVVGVTGTNGKTTTAWLLRDMLSSVGRRPAYVGTLGITTPAGSRLLENTTPFAVELNNLIAEAVRDGADSLTMEVSSHALNERRADGIEFDAGVFTNLTQDHLDYHGSMEEYEAAKLRFFEELPSHSSKAFTAAINADEETGERWLARIRTRKLGYGLSKGELRGTPVEVKVDRIRMVLCHQGQQAEALVPLGGTFNVYNSLSAAAGFVALGYSIEQAAEALAHVRPVPGRFEPVPNDRGIHVLVDYAHTPDALEKLLDSVRKLGPSRLITVFGCGGDRDRSKRPKMARAASERSDLTVLTSDNPRTENPQWILDEVAIGLQPDRESLKIIDRREAIHHAVRVAQPGDVVVIAGKGHENYQIIGRTKYPMDDRELAREALEALP